MRWFTLGPPGSVRAEPEATASLGWLDLSRVDTAKVRRARLAEEKRDTLVATLRSTLAHAKHRGNPRARHVKAILEDALRASEWIRRDISCECVQYDSACVEDDPRDLHRRAS